MIKSIFLILLCLCSFLTFSQEKVVWSSHYDNSSETLLIEANIAEGWHLYSQNISVEIGPVPTTFEFEENSAIKIIGKTTEPESIREYDENFGGELNFFKNKVVFEQKMKVFESTSVKGLVTYMICSDTVCLPPKDVEFVVQINK